MDFARLGPLRCCAVVALCACHRDSPSSERVSPADVAVPRPVVHRIDASAGSTTAPPAATAELVPPHGRIFFGKSPTQIESIATEELFLAREGGDLSAILRGDDLPSPRLEGNHLKSTTPIGEMDLTLHDDGSFEGERVYHDGSKGHWVRVPYRPLRAEQLAKPVDFQGFVGTTLRYRARLVIDGTEVTGVVRYTVTRKDLRLRGHVDLEARTLTLDELGDGDRVTGRLDAFVLGHDHSLLLRGIWTSADGSKRLPLALDGGDYPARIDVGGGAALAAQERYVDNCGIVEEYVFPVVDGAPAIAATLDPALKALTLQGMSPEPPGPEVVREATPLSSVRQHCPHRGPDDRGMESGVYSATLLHDGWIAVEVEHYHQEGAWSGDVWLSCVAVDLRSGALVEPAKLLDPQTRDTLTVRARKDALADVSRSHVPDAMAEDFHSVAAELSLEDVPLCIEQDKVRFGLVSHRVFGPAQPVFERAEVARLLPAGELKDLVATRTAR